MERRDTTAGHERASWHALPREEVLDRLEAEPAGLSSSEALRRMERHGPNRLPGEARTSPIKRFLRQFPNVLIYVLLAAAAGTALLGLWLDTGVILAVVLINAIIGFVQEGKAEKALDAIRGMLSPRASVRRDGRRKNIDAEALVPGDIVYLGAGDRVPADLRLLAVKSLRADEALLTGESVAVDKSVEPVEAGADLGDRSAMAFSGTLITGGQASGVVVATGAKTEIGHISVMLGEVEELTTPLLRQITQFGRWLAAAILVLAGLTFVFGYWVQGYELVNVSLAAMSLAVAAIPEGLPAIMTVTLATGVQRMARRNAIIRRLPAVETLGSVTVICADKTGTLTRNEMTVKTVVTAATSFGVSGVGYEPHGEFTVDGGGIEPAEEPLLQEVLRAGLLCNDAQLRQRDGRWQLEGEATDGALVVAALKGGLDHRELSKLYPRVDIIPFDSARKFMATLHHDHEGHGFIYLKGAPERVLEVCARVRTATGDEPVDRAHWDQAMASEAADGQRLLAIATKDVSPDKHVLDFADVESEMTLLGLVGIIDPPREEAIAAVAECREAGIQVKMITGDHELTARAVAGALGIDTGGGVVTGHEIEDKDGEELARAAAEASVFSRATPEHKLRLIKALQASRHVVAMTGDGVNDAPALKRADVGIAMGIKGTDAAKEASEMVLTDDNFASIVHAVEAGRAVYDNLRKTILFLLPTNGGQSFTIVAAILLGTRLPLSPVQVLWVNMVTAVTLAIALAFEPTEPEVMKRAPRDASRPILSAYFIWRVGFVSLLLVAGTFGHFLWMEQQYFPLDVARTIAINTLVSGQLFYLFNCRFILEPSYRGSALRGSRVVLIAVGALIALQTLFTYARPLHAAFGTAPLAPADWGRVLAFGILVFVLVELEKALLRRRLGRTLS